MTANREDPWLRVGTVAAALYLALLPFRNLMAPKNLCLGVALACALVIWWRQGRERPPLIAAFSFWFLAGALSLLWSHDVVASQSAIWRDVVKSWLVFFAYYVLAVHRASLVTLVRIGTVGALAFALIAIHDFSTHGYWDNVFTPGRYDVAVDALNWMVFIGMAIPLLRERDRRLVAPAIAAVLLCAAAGFLTRNRSFTLSLVTGIGFLSALNLPDILRRRRTLAAVAASTILALSIGLALLDHPLATYQDRWQLYSAVWQKISANPWLGTGYGHETDQRWYQATFGGFRLPDVPNAITHAHNIVLSFMDQLGIAGLLVLIVLFGSLARPLWIAHRSGSPGGPAIFGHAGLLLVVLTLLADSFNYFFVRQHLWMFFALSGLYLGWIRAGTTQTQWAGPDIS